MHGCAPERLLCLAPLCIPAMSSKQTYLKVHGHGRLRRTRGHSGCRRPEGKASYSVLI